MVRVKSKNVKAVSAMFNDPKLRGIDGFKCGRDYIEVTCGCTSRKYGDAAGQLRIFSSGQFLINCLCNSEHNEGSMTPAEFEKHSLRQAPLNWKNNIWVIFDKDKVPKPRKIGIEDKTKFSLRQAGLLKYYKQIANLPNGGRNRRKWKFHRDEFIRCSRCAKERRFRLRSNEECRIYHDAVTSRRWKCSDRPYETVRCEDDEERESRKICRGCPRVPSCKGCTSCVCFGCLKCRFSDCNCRVCFDFMHNGTA